jgi:hypothetical protein
MTKVKTYRNSGRSNICHGTFIALWRVIKRQYNDQSKDITKRWLSHVIYYFYHYFCISLLWSLYCLFITLHKAMIVPWHILLLPLFLYVFTLVIVLSFYNPSQCDECPMTYITSTTISVCLYFGHYIVFL